MLLNVTQLKNITPHPTTPTTENYQAKYVNSTAAQKPWNKAVNFQRLCCVLGYFPISIPSPHWWFREELSTKKHSSCLGVHLPFLKQQIFQGFHLKNVPYSVSF